jgi:hypothetical protein
MPAPTLLDKEMARQHEQAKHEEQLGSMRSCWACGTPCAAPKFREPKRCGRCVEFAGTARFCSESCMCAYWARHEKWHEQQDAKEAAARARRHREERARMAQQEVKTQWVRQATEKRAQCKAEYSKLIALAEAEAAHGHHQAAAAIAQRAVAVEPTLPVAYGVLSKCFTASGQWLRASDCCLAELQRRAPDSRRWAQCVSNAWATRARAAPCGANDAFCGCALCAELPRLPEWMGSPAELAKTAELVVAADSGDAAAWFMHAKSHAASGDPPVAANSYHRAGVLWAEQGRRANAAACESAAEECIKRARADARWMQTIGGAQRVAGR